MDKSGNKIGDRQPGKGPIQGKEILPIGGEKALGSLDYFKEAKLFCTKDRATLTFFSSEGVASIHFDTKRNEIFYKGHNVKNMTLSQEQWDSLQKFSELLTKKDENPHLLKAYQACLEMVLPGHP